MQGEGVVDDQGMPLVDEADEEDGDRKPPYSADGGASRGGCEDHISSGEPTDELGVSEEVNDSNAQGGASAANDTTSLASEAAAAVYAAQGAASTGSAAVVPTKKQQPARKPRKKKPVGVKRALSAYNIFFRDERARILQARDDGNPGEIGESKAAELFSAMGKAIAKRWKELEASDRAYYVEAAATDMKRYRKEMDDYHTSLALNQARPPAIANMGSESLVALQHLPLLAHDSFGSATVSQQQHHFMNQSMNFLDSSNGSLDGSSLQQQIERAALAASTTMGTSSSTQSSSSIGALFPTEERQLLELLRQRDALSLASSNSGGAGDFGLSFASSDRNSARAGSNLTSLLTLQNQFTSQERQHGASLNANASRPDALSLLQEMQQRQSLEEQYMQASLEQEQARMTTARLARELQLRGHDQHQHQQQQQQQQELQLRRQQEMAYALRLQEQQQSGMGPLAGLSSQLSRHRNIGTTTSPQLLGGRGGDIGHSSNNSNALSPSNRALLQLLRQQQNEEEGYFAGPTSRPGSNSGGGSGGVGGGAL